MSCHPLCLYRIPWLKKELRLEKSMYEILQFLSVSIFEKTYIIEALSKSDHAEINEPPYLQGELW